MDRDKLIQVLAARAGVPNLYISDKFDKWPMVFTTEDEVPMQQELLKAFGGIVETMHEGRKEAGHQRWVVQFDEALALMAELRPYLWGWRAKVADVWLSMGRRETYERVADIYP